MRTLVLDLDVPLIHSNTGMHAELLRGSDAKMMRC